VRRVARVAGALLAAALLVAGLAAWLAWRQLDAFRSTPFGTEEEKVVEVLPGASARAVARALAKAGVLSDAELASRYVRFLKRDPRPLKQGEYAFSGPLTPDEVLERIYRGEVRLYRFTVPEGLRIDDIAEIVGRSGLASADNFLLLAHSAAEANALGVPADNLEGYLFPDTYAFARGVTAKQILESMVHRSHEEYERANARRHPEVTLDRAAVMTLASIIEKETGQAAERPRISCVFHRRLARKMRLQTDPTVMYATYLRTGRWSKNISRADLLTPHPYNTYALPGLPPGPIANPGAAAIQAALAPAECSDLFFVSRNDGTHVFCPDLACHEQAVRQWQVEYFRRKKP
jgi:UPF0755 protein